MASYFQYRRRKIKNPDEFHSVESDSIELHSIAATEHEWIAVLPKW